MQEKILNAVAAEAEERAQLQPTPEKPFQASKDKAKGVYFPEHWRKKKLHPSFVKELEKTANSEPFAQDEYGEYRLGKFLHSCAMVVVGVIDNLWTLEIHSENPIGLPMIQEIRYKYLPDNLMMAMLFLPRKERTSAKTIVLYQIPGNLKDAGIEEDEE